MSGYSTGCEHISTPPPSSLENYKLAAKLGLAASLNATEFVPACQTCGNTQSAICCLECDFIGCPTHASHPHHLGTCFGPSLETPLWCFVCKDVKTTPPFEQARQNVLHSLLAPSALPPPAIDAVAPSSFKKFTGLRGIINLGSTCYASAVLQSLVHNPLVKTFFLTAGHEREKCPAPGCLVCSLDKIYTDFFGTDLVTGYGITDMVIKMAEKQPLMGAGSTEQDAHEFYLMMLSEFHKTHYASKSPCTCITHRYFTGALRSTLTCECSATATREESMIDLGLDLGQTPSTTLSECLERFTSSELVANYTCDKCGEAQKTRKRLQIDKLPPVLMVQLKRFKIFGSSSTKVESPVDFGMEIDMAPFLSEKPKNKIIYELFGVICHTGSLDTGHYTCFMRHNTGMWFHFDDSMVTQVDASQVKQTRTAYLLLYIVKTVI